MKAYKGFTLNTIGLLECRGFIYTPNKKHVFVGNIGLCKRGFHACRELSDVWGYYPNNGDNVYYEVECGGEIKQNDKDSKIVCSEITILNEIDISKIAKFDYMGSFNKEGYAVVSRNNNKGYNFINRKGQLISDQWYDNVYNFNDGFAVVELFSKGYNLLNRNGELISDQWYDNIWDFNDGYAAVKLNSKGWNFIDRKGKIVFRQWYDNACPFSGGYAPVEFNTKWYQLRKDGVLCDYDTKQPINKL